MVADFHHSARREDNEAAARRKASELGIPEPWYFCWACGRRLDPAKLRYVIYEHSCYVALTKEDAMTWPIDHDYWELAGVPVGPECARKYGKDHWFTSQAEVSKIVEESLAKYEAWKAEAKTVAEAEEAA